MANSILKLTFNNVTSRQGEKIRFTLKSSSGNIISTYIYTFYEFGVNGTGTIYPDQSVTDPEQKYGLNAAKAFVTTNQIYYDHPDKLLISRENNVVTIEALIQGSIFTDVITGVSQSGFLDNNDSVISKPLYVSSYVVSKNVGNECNNFDLKLTTNRDVVKITTQGSVENLAPTNVIDKTLLRGVSYSFILETSDGSIVKWPSTGPLLVDHLQASNFDVKEVSSFGVKSINITDNEPSSITKEYSLNNADWQSETTFTNLASGNYTLYIRDFYRRQSLGCTVTKDFTISEDEEIELEKKPIVSISKTNSISFVKREETDNVNIFKNVSNSLSHEQKFAYLYCDEILFQRFDNTKIQLKTSYDTVNVTLRKSDGTEDEIAVNKLSDNIGKFKSMDAIIEHYKDGLSILYFNSGNYYDKLGNQIDSYTLNGNLPEFGDFGTKIEVGGVVVEVLDVVYLDSIKRRCLVIPYNHNGNGPEEVIIKSEYSILDYNIFDFDIFWNLYSEGIYDVVIEFIDDQFDTVYYQSENINLAEDHPETVAIRYFNTNNRDIFYKYGIEHFIRVPIVAIEDFIEDSVETNTTDTNVVVLQSTLNEGHQFFFDDMTRNMFIKVAIALSCEFVFINGIGYSKQEPFEAEPIKGTNLSRLSAKMLINGMSYNNIDEYVKGGVEENSNVDIPVFDTEGVELIRISDNLLNRN